MTQLSPEFKKARLRRRHKYLVASSDNEEDVPSRRRIRRYVAEQQTDIPAPYICLPLDLHLSNAAPSQKRKWFPNTTLSPLVRVLQDVH